MSHLRPPALWKAGQILFNKRAGFLLIVMGQGIALHLEIVNNIKKNINVLTMIKFVTVNRQIKMVFYKD